MTRPLDIRHDDILGRLDWIESQIASKSKSTVGAEALADAYPVQMRAPGVFPEDREQVPASETFAVVDSIRAKAEGELRHLNPIAPMEAPPIDRMAAEAKLAAHDSFEADRKVLENISGKITAQQVDAVHRAENDAVGNAVTGARTGELPADEVMDDKPTPKGKAKADKG